MEYVAGKVYKWEPTDSFTLTGSEFALAINVMMEKKKELLRQLEVVNLLESKLKDAVEKGMAVEKVE